MNLFNIQLPSQKETAAGVAGLIVWAACWGLSFAGIVVPIEAQTGLTLFVAVIVAKVVPASDQDILHRVNDTIAQAGTIVGKLTPASDSTAPVTAAAQHLANTAS